ncbi:MAG: PEFG-CTERM sorting domain-containing protein, partial [Thermoproteota archaeon]
ETQFTFSPKTETTETKTFEVDAGNHGTFDVEYSIEGGTVKDMLVDEEIFALIVIIESTDDGSISLEIPRYALDAKKQDETDDIFIIIIDGIEAPYQETITDSNSRVITINFEQGDSDIEIIGTTIIPEFGTIAMMVLAIGIITTIFVTKNKFQMPI